ncbi:hypothetical protein [Aeromicrobium sp. NPDC092404]|uniref:hypothetical protein n=1 Tax=Aeromicrobium sp. NPDC092404 TaxID=3154976 RepID=UPI00341E55DA
MRSRLRLAVLATFVIGLVLAGLGSVVAKSPEQRDEIRAADAVAQRFDRAVSRYVSDAAADIASKHDADQDGYPALLKLAQAKLRGAPELGERGTTSYGREHSDDYQSAEDRRRAALQSLADLETYLRKRAIPDSKFIAAGKKLVGLRPGTLLGDDPVLNGDPLRERVLPAYKKARSQVEKQSVPEGSRLLKLDLVTYADDVIAQTKDGAEKIDDQEAFFFQLGDRPVELFQRLAAFESGIQVQVDEQVQIVAASQ